MNRAIFRCRKNQLNFAISPFIIPPSFVQIKLQPIRYAAHTFSTCKNENWAINEFYRLDGHYRNDFTLCGARTCGPKVLLEVLLARNSRYTHTRYVCVLFRPLLISFDLNLEMNGEINVKGLLNNPNPKEFDCFFFHNWWKRLKNQHYYNARPSR